MEMMMEIAKNKLCDARKMEKEVMILYNTRSQRLPSGKE